MSDKENFDKDIEYLVIKELKKKLNAEDLVYKDIAEIVLKAEERKEQADKITYDKEAEKKENAYKLLFPEDDNDTINERLEKEESTRVKTGYNMLDKAIKMTKGSVTTFLARTGHGKTNMMLNIMHNLSQRENNQLCIYVSFEGRKEDYIRRFKNMVYRKNTRDFRLNHEFKNDKLVITERDSVVDKKYQSLVHSKEKKVVFLHDPSIEDLQDVIDIAHEKDRKDIVLFLDYAQIMTGLLSNQNIHGYEAIKGIMKVVNNLTNREGKEVVTFTASQVNEAGEAREGRDIENYSDNVVRLIWHAHPSMDKPKKRTDNGNPKYYNAYSSAKYPSKEMPGENLTLMTFDIVKSRSESELSESFLTGGGGLCNRKCIIECLDHISKNEKVRNLSPKQDNKEDEKKNKPSNTAEKIDQDKSEWNVPGGQI